MRKEDLKYFVQLFNSLDYESLVTKYYTFGNPASYPKYNIIAVDENHIRIDLALAGKNRTDVDLEVKDGFLYILGKKVESKEKYIYKAISDKEFSVKYPLLETQSVKSAIFENGILSIYIENIIPEQKKPKKIEIM